MFRYFLIDSAIDFRSLCQAFFRSLEDARFRKNLVKHWQGRQKLMSGNHRSIDAKTTSSEQIIEYLSKNKRNFDRKTTCDQSEKTSFCSSKTRAHVNRKTIPRAPSAKRRSESVPDVSKECLGPSRLCPGSIPERPESILGASWGVPRASWSVPGASPERPRSVPMRPRSLRRHSGAILERFGFDFSLPGRFSEPSWAIFALIFLAPSFACAASTTR